MKNILILGGGYGGLMCFIRLQKILCDEDVKVTLISKHDYHYPTTLLHKLSVGTYSARKARIFFRLLIKRPNFHFEKDIIERIDVKSRIVHAKYSCYSYDYLVIALGFEGNTFGIKGTLSNTYKLTSLKSALNLRSRIETKFKDFRFKTNPLDLSFAVCGSGFTGVEFVAELAIEANILCEISGIDRNLVKIYLIGRGERILPMLNEKLSQIATNKLRQIKVEVIQASVIECKPHAVVIEKSDGQISEIPCATTLWAAGVKGNHVIENSGLADKNSRVEVDPFLRLPKCKFDKNHAEISKNLDENHTNTNQAKSTCEGSLQNVFVIGDCAIAVARDVIHAPTAQLAYQMGDYCADAIKRILHEKPLKKPFKFKHRGTVCSLGHTYAVGQIYGFGISGEKAAFMKNFIENKWIYNVAGIKNVIQKGQFRFRSSY